MLEWNARVLEWNARMLESSTTRFKIIIMRYAKGTLVHIHNGQTDRLKC